MNQKRIVIIEGDAFDADAIVAIVTVGVGTYGVTVHTEHKAFECYFDDAPARDAAMAVAVDAWRKAVGDLPVVDAMPPEEPQPEEEFEDFTLHWTDGKGTYYETYGGNRIFTGTKTGRFIWNEGPPRRKNTLGPGASPILKVYVDEAGKVLDPQPV